jgi:histidine ammonia-lyase
MKPFSLGSDRLSWSALVSMASKPHPSVDVSNDALKRLELYRGLVESAIASGKTIYGINTGFGFLSDVRIDSDKLQTLQCNLIRSHACGVGEPAALEVIRALLLLRAHTFLLGHSAVSRRAVDTVLAFLKHDILPLVPVQGSVGASGDLAPLAHVALGLIGEGEVFYKGERMPTKNALKASGVAPLVPSAKEGLSLINGTQFMAVLGAFAVRDAKILSESADIIAALSLEAIKGSKVAFDSRIHAVREQPGQKKVAAHMWSLLSGEDEIMASHANCGRVQEPYSFRCIPQVHGATRDVIDFVTARVDGDLNSVTDNPLVFEDGAVLSGGNFHGQPLAMALDFLGIAVAELGSIAERRIEKLTNPAMSGLPAFLVKESGLNSGFMIPHVVAAALVSENKILCHPASVDSIPTSADKEDHVSMGPIAARKALKICSHVADILAIEALTAAQGVDLHAPLKPSLPLINIHDKIRQLSPAMPTDRSLHPDIALVSDWIKAGGALEGLR